MSAGICSNKAFESDFGKRILLKYGWQEGQGLGRLENGRTDCIQTTRRELKTGLGAEKRKGEDNWDNWWADCFNNVAKKVSVTADKETKSSADSDSDSDSEDDTKQRDKDGGRVLCVKKAGMMQGKLRRVLRQETSTVR